jgi:DNA-binding beta-propeller fold protein YncE
MKRTAKETGALALLLLASACATPVRKEEAPLFFPPAPGLPRIQYLTSFRGLKDVEEQSSFNRFVVGEQQDLRIDKPYGVALHDGRLYVCDTNASVIVFDLVSRRYSGLKGAVGPGKLIQPINISIEADGTKFVADPARGQVVVFDRNDDYVRAYGTPGNWRPVDAVPFADRVYVADPANGLVKVFDRASGEQVRTIGDKGVPSERLDRPTNLAFDGDGYLYVTDAGRFQILKFDRDGHYRSAVGRPGDNLGHFARPKGIAVDREGRLYAVDASFNNVQIFNREGRLLMYFGESGDVPGGFLLPAKVAIDYDNVKYFAKHVAPQFQVEYLLLVTSQFGERPLTILAFGQEKGKRYPTEEELLREIEEKRGKEQESQPAP